MTNSRNIGPTAAFLAAKTTLCALAVFAAPAAAQLNYEQLGRSIVRVEVDGRLSTGFIWQQPDQVVTALHAMRDNAEIWVRCGPYRQRATIRGVHQDADLVLLGTQPFGSNCSPIRTAITEKPVPDQKLYTLGYYAGGHSMANRYFFKAYAEPPETISSIVGTTDGVVDALRARKSPSVNLAIYHVQGGLLPGFSGAPVFDERGNVVAVVNGGLKHGFANFNWAIPAKHLFELRPSGSVQVPVSASGAESLFAHGFSENEPNPVIAYRQDEWDYKWVKTRSMSLAEVLSTSDQIDLDDMRELFYEYQSVFGADAESRMRFDIYEDIDNGLIIALPVGQNLEVNQTSDGYNILESHVPPNGWDGYIQFEQLSWGFVDETPSAPVLSDSDDGFVVDPGPSGPIWPGDPRYFDAMVADILADCNKPPDQECVMVPDTREEYEYPGDNKVLKVSFVTQETGYPARYDFYSFNVRGRDEVTFQVWGRIHAAENDIFNCVDDPELDGCYNSAAAFANLQTMLAVSLSTTSRFYKPAAPMMLRAE